MGIVVFNPATFATLYPEFSGLSTGLTTNAFNLAMLYLSNTDSSVVTDLTERTTLLNLLTAHLTKIEYGTNDGAGHVSPPLALVGRIEIAKEGSVHVRTDMGSQSSTAAWYNQTRYGAAYWAATIKYRTVRYARPSWMGFARPWGRSC